MWHISNELGGYCYCETCRKKFQEWLADRYDHDGRAKEKAAAVAAAWALTETTGDQ